MLSIIKSMSLFGLNGYLIDVQVDVSAGLPCFEIVGLPDTSIRESKERVKVAIKNSGFNLYSRKILVNLAPATKRKEGSIYDLPIAIGILSANEFISTNTNNIAFLGELSLDGKVNKINGILPMCIELKKLGIKKVVLPQENAKEAGIVKGIQIIPVSSLCETVEYLNNKIEINFENIEFEDLYVENINNNIDFAEVKGQHNIKRAIEVAASRCT